MIKRIKYKKGCISYNIVGEGAPVVLLHGYLETHLVWKYTSDLLSKTNKVISIDLTGHGNSDVISDVHTMGDMAQVVAAVLDFENISMVVIVGHSMGGYVALEFLNCYKNFIKGVALIHSTPSPDSEEKSLNRDREIALIRRGKFDVICNIAIPSMFSDNVSKKMEKEISELIKNALSMDPKSAIAALFGMQRRKNHHDLLNESDLPKLVVSGAIDRIVEFNCHQINAISNLEHLVLANCGHMGFLEKKEIVTKCIQKFVNNCY